MPDNPGNAMLEENLVETFGASLRNHWPASCFSDLGGSAISYGDVANRIFRLHHIFDRLGMERGDRVALVGRNTVNWAVTYLATVSYGAVIVPILPDFTPGEIEHLVRHSGAKLMVAAPGIFDGLDPEHMEPLQGVFGLLDMGLIWHRNTSLPGIVKGADTGYVEQFRDRLSRETLTFGALGGDTLAAIVYTSGTTGFSKGVMLTHNALMANVQHFSVCVELKAEDRIVSFLPLAHAFGCSFDFLAPFACGCHVVFVEQIPSPKILVAAFEEHRPVVVMSVPLIIEKIYRNRIRPIIETPRMRTMLKIPGLNRFLRAKLRDKIYEVFGGNYRELVIGGAALNREVEAFFRLIGLNITCGYGMTECGPLISYTVSADQPPLGSVGRMIPHLECRIHRPDPATGIGEVHVRGENVMLGYYRDEEATSAAIDPDGWLYTGDLGHLDDEGFLYLTGRCKNMILSASGQNIYPEEIESRINNLPCVEESLVIDHGGKLVALVYPDLEAMDRACLKDRQMQELMETNRQQLNEDLPSYARISEMRIMFEEFEKTPTRKIKRTLYTAAT
ncbi:long-chain fatty acid--CoA ligase [bacterium CG17_big_fil_post_rev_8_21_14_2_50_64_8]|nr:MAG: long-chain fatty acid--CoA ligase [bacterium CG17_big_fil_post_rev_8_21_14_2_50_64_8]PJA73201.1 MAG: long-chain fatty acid--CoA ligase [bacterium CG_4_9_14_3_um_filter_65_15]